MKRKERELGFGVLEGEKEGMGRKGKESEESVCVKAKEREFGSKRKDFAGETEGGRESLVDCTSTCQGICTLGFWLSLCVILWEIQRLFNLLVLYYISKRARHGYCILRLIGTVECIFFIRISREFVHHFFFL